MYEVAVEQEFDAAHYLRGYQGKCENVHGHRFRVVARVRAKETDDIGMAYDFTRLRQQLGQVVGRFDHVCLNDTPPFDKINPSSENIASTIFTELQPILTGTGFSLSNIQVWESPHSSVTYFPEGE
ncbi:MAG: 6-carboxytetrahydropterin synthase QueD [Chloroflexi bacterium RBG_13_53_26]|jgi:6-pyruvoyltetrahydropterin/6-carboxytetrahydropterin synthase|nr:MAG: 6-carboxytetrahydropterin synthase QueD [Chloroflexi bacterium RBG_13_53_26]